MGCFNEGPDGTAADWAQSAADRANRNIDFLNNRLLKLELEVDDLKQQFANHIHYNSPLGMSSKPKLLEK